MAPPTEDPERRRTKGSMAPAAPSVAPPASSTPSAGANAPLTEKQRPAAVVAHTGLEKTLIQDVGAHLLPRTLEPRGSRSVPCDPYLPAGAAGAGARERPGGRDTETGAARRETARVETHGEGTHGPPRGVYAATSRSPQGQW